MWTLLLMLDGEEADKTLDDLVRATIDGSCEWEWVKNKNIYKYMAKEKLDDCGQ